MTTDDKKKEIIVLLSHFDSDKYINMIYGFIKGLSKYSNCNSCIRL